MFSTRQIYQKTYRNIVISEDLLFIFRKQLFMRPITHISCLFSRFSTILSCFIKRWHFWAFSEKHQFNWENTVGKCAQIMKSLYTPLPLDRSSISCNFTNKAFGLDTPWWALWRERYTRMYILIKTSPSRGGLVNNMKGGS